MGMLSDAMGEMVGEITDLKQKLNKLQREYDHEKSFVHYLKKKHCEDLEALRQGKCSEQEYRRGYSAGHEEGYNQGYTAGDSTRKKIERKKIQHDLGALKAKYDEH